MLQLYSYYRSSASYRVRIALNVKDIAHQINYINLLAGEQQNATYRAINQQRLVPTLVDGDFTLSQSMAILEYLEDKYPETPLLPPDPQGRAHVRQIANIIACDMHSLNNLRTLNYLQTNFDISGDQKNEWYYNWLTLGFDAIEKLISKFDKDNNFCYDQKISLADVCLVPQVFNALRFSFEMDRYERIMQIYNNCMTILSFQKASPEQQADMVK